MMQWIVIHSKVRKEELLFNQLSIRNIDAYLPSIRVLPVNPRARKIKPYFPGYVFARVDLEHTGISILQWTPGAIGIVNFGGEPAYVPDHFINTLEQHLQKINSSGYAEISSLNPGDAVDINGGPFAGYKAIFDTRLHGTDRVRVLIKMLQDYQIRVELPANQITWKKPAFIQA